MRYSRQRVNTESVFYFNETSPEQSPILLILILKKCFRNMTSFGNIRRCLATTACKQCVVLYVIHFGCAGRILCVFGIDVLSRMSSSLLCIYSLHFLSHSCVTNV